MLASLTGDDAEKQELTIGQICMLKLLMEQHGLYKKEAGVGDGVTFTSRRLEQLILNGLAQRYETEHLLPSVLGEILDGGSQGQDIAARFLSTPEEILQRCGLLPAQETALKYARRQGELPDEEKERAYRWCKFLELSRQIVGGSLNFDNAIHLATQAP
jgi:hypothetical protein